MPLWVVLGGLVWSDVALLVYVCGEAMIGIERRRASEYVGGWVGRWVIRTAAATAQY